MTAPTQDEVNGRMAEVQKGELTALTDAFTVHGARVIRDWVRSVLVPEALLRLYKIGMGVEKFKIPTEKGLIDVPAFASVQVEALSKVVDVGVPRQLGLVDNTGEDLPGVMLLGPLDLEEAQRANRQQLRLVAGNGHPSNGGASVSPADPDSAVFSRDTGDSADHGDVILSPSVRAGGYEIVEVPQDAMAAPDGQKPGELPPPPVERKPTLAQEILARRRAAKNARPPSADEHP